MRFSILVAGFAAAASAASTTAVGESAAQKSAAACLKACKTGDVNCQSHCITVPSPNMKQANATVDCVASCDQGKGTAKDNAAYKVCVDDCVQNNFYVHSVGTPEQTGAAGSSGDSKSAATATGSSGSKATGSSGSKSGSKTGSSGDSSSTATGTSSSASATSSKSAGNAVAVGAASIVGFFAAVLAL